MTNLEILLLIGVLLCLSVKAIALLVFLRKYRVFRQPVDRMVTVYEWRMERRVPSEMAESEPSKMRELLLLGVVIALVAFGLGYLAHYNGWIHLPL